MGRVRLLETIPASHLLNRELRSLTHTCKDARANFQGCFSLPRTPPLGKRSFPPRGITKEDLREKGTLTKRAVRSPSRGHPRLGSGASLPGASRRRTFAT